jgi:hypothetical protein
VIEFENPLTAGTVLVREQIQSQNFVAGSDGWVIKANGDAEFNSVVIRGATVVSGLALYYDGTPALGTLILSIAAEAGTDIYGNAYPQGLGVFGSDGELTADGSTLTVAGANGSQVQLSTGGVGQADIFFTPRDLVGSTWFDGTVGTVLGSGDRPGISITAPAADVPGATASSIDLYGSGAGGLEAYILVACDRFNVNGLFQAPNLQSGQASISFVGLSSFTQAVVFPEAYAVGTVPVVTTNIASSAGVTARWGSRAYNISNTGFTLFLFEGDSADPVQTWANIPVQWWAHAD